MPAAPEPIVELAGVSKSFGSDARSRALADVDLSIAPGEIFGIIGESGAGKTTLLNLLTGTLAPSAGGVRVLGQEVGGLDRAGLRALRRQIGVVFQGVHLVANRTVRANVAAPLRLRGRRGRATVDAAVSDALRFVGLDEMAARFPAQLSGGQRQRIGIARALVTDPRLLICDEPTSALDGATADGVLDLLTEARETRGATVIVVTHDLDVVRAVCDRVALFEQGHLREVIPVARRARTRPASYLERAREVLGE